MGTACVYVRVHMFVRVCTWVGVRLYVCVCMLRMCAEESELGRESESVTVSLPDCLEVGTVYKFSVCVPGLLS